MSQDIGASTTRKLENSDTKNPGKKVPFWSFVVGKRKSDLFGKVRVLLYLYARKNVHFGQHVTGEVTYEK
jgi:hypothetical protein